MADGGAPRSTPTRRELADLRGSLARVLAAVTGGRWRVELSVPGRHYSGLSNNELIEILASQDRDFAHATTAMRSHVRSVVAMRFEGASRVPRPREIEAVMDEAVVDWIVKRFDGVVRDQHLRLLTIPYAKAKAKAGYGSKSIGFRTGSLAAAVADHGRVVIVH